MRRALIWSAAVLVLLAAGTAVLFFALRPTAPPYQQLAADFIRAVNKKDDPALQNCLLAARLRPEDRSDYGYPADVALAVPDAETLWSRYEKQLTGIVKNRMTGYEFTSNGDAISRQSSLELTLNSLEPAGCTAEKDRQAEHPTYSLTLYVRTNWTDQKGADHTELMTITDIRAVEYRGDWYLNGL